MANKQKDQDKSLEDLKREIKELYDKCSKDDPEEADLESFREYLKRNPGIYSFVSEVASHVERRIIDEINPDQAYAIYIETSIWQMRLEMGYDNAPIIERILIDNIINCWLRLISVELSPRKPLNFKREIREDRLNTTQNRFRQACLTYIRVKKLISKTPALQINFTTGTAQQVNVTGGATKSAENEEN